MLLSTLKSIAIVNPIPCGIFSFVEIILLRIEIIHKKANHEFLNKDFFAASLYYPALDETWKFVNVNIIIFIVLDLESLDIG